MVASDVEAVRVGAAADAVRVGADATGSEPALLLFLDHQFALQQILFTSTVSKQIHKYNFVNISYIPPSMCFMAFSASSALLNST